jgi:hypothetical protein
MIWVLNAELDNEDEGIRIEVWFVTCCNIPSSFLMQDLPIFLEDIRPPSPSVLC